MPELFVHERICESVSFKEFAAAKTSGCVLLRHGFVFGKMLFVKKQATIFQVFTILFFILS